MKKIGLMRRLVLVCGDAQMNVNQTNTQLCVTFIGLCEKTHRNQRNHTGRIQTTDHRLSLMHRFVSVWEN